MLNKDGMPIPWHLLQTLVVVVRCQRMARAAAALGITPGAVSQRIKELEHKVARRLLLRSRSGLELTRSGEKLFRAVAGPLDGIAASYRDLTTHRASRRIVINTVPSFAALWLVPRLASFTAAHPDVEIAIETDSRVIDLTADPVDLAIRHGLGRYEGLESHWLTAPASIVVASPALLRKGPPIRAPLDCLRYPLLHDIERRDWPLLFAGLGIKADIPMVGSAFADDHLLVRAAASGQGLALVASTYAEGEIAAGRLVNPLKVRWPTKFAYYLVGRPQTMRRAAVRKFKTWIVAEAAGNPNA